MKVQCSNTGRQARPRLNATLGGRRGTMSTITKDVSSVIRRALLIVAAIIPPLSLASAELAISRDSVQEKAQFLLYSVFDFDVRNYLDQCPAIICLADAHKRVQLTRKSEVRTAGIAASIAASITILLLSLNFNIRISMICPGSPDLLQPRSPI